MERRGTSTGSDCASFISQIGSGDEAMANALSCSQAKIFMQAFDLVHALMQNGHDTNVAI
jgi:hypothetical protein